MLSFEEFNRISDANDSQSSRGNEHWLEHILDEVDQWFLGIFVMRESVYLIYHKNEVLATRLLDDRHKLLCQQMSIAPWL